MGYEAELWSERKEWEWAAKGCAWFQHEMNAG